MYKNSTRLVGGNAYFLPILVLLLFYNTIQAQSYTLSSSPDSTEVVCPGDTAYYLIDVGTIGGYNDPVSLTISGLPSGASASWSSSPVVTPGSSISLIIDSDLASPGIYSISVLASASAGSQTLVLNFEIVPPSSPSTTASTTMLQPADGASGVSMPVDFLWTNAGNGYSYQFVVALDTTFSTIIDSTITTDTSYTSNLLNQNTNYYWYVMVIDSSLDSTSSFCPGLSFPTNINYYSFSTEDLCANISLGLYSIEPHCFGECTGEIFTNVNGGTSPYSYNWTTGMTSAHLTGVCAGYYEVTITDLIGCNLTASIIVTEPSPLTITSVFPISNYNGAEVSCFGACDAEAQAQVQGGTPPYSFLWSTGGTSETEMGLCPGSHSIIAFDINGCQAQNNLIINDVPLLSIVDTTINPLSCANQCDGTISHNITGGNPPYYYQWSNGENAAITTGLCAGNYTVSISDINGCMISSTTALGNPSLLEVNLIDSLNPSCLSCSDGFAVVSVSGGSGSYNYNWSNGQTSDTLSNVQAGNYTLILTDSFGCEAQISIHLDAPSSFKKEEISTAVDIYPNPSRGYFNIDIKNLEFEKFYIQDFLGRIIYDYKIPPHESFIQINSSQWPKGIYTLNFINSTTNKRLSKKIVLLQN